MSMTIRCRKEIQTSGYQTTLAYQQTNSPAVWAYYLKESLVKAGWTVYRSSAGLTVADSDLWTASNFQEITFQYYTQSANTTRTIDGIWSCLQSPSGNLHIMLSPRLVTWANLDGINDSNNANTTNSLYSAGSIANGGAYHPLTGLGLGSMVIGISYNQFTGGLPAVEGDNETVLGELPVSTDADLSTVSFAFGGSASPSVSAYNHPSDLTVLTEGDLFTVIMSNGSYNNDFSYPDFGNHISFFSLREINNFGYCLLKSNQRNVGNGTSSSTGYSAVLGKPAILGGLEYFTDYTSTYQSSDASGSSVRIETQIGKLGSTFLVKENGTIYSGLLEDPTPKAWEALCLTPYFKGEKTYPTVCQLQAISLADSYVKYLDVIDDGILLGGDPLVSTDVITYNGETYLFLKGVGGILIKWDNNDNPNEYITIDPSI